MCSNHRYKQILESERQTRGKRCHICGIYQRRGEFAHKNNTVEQTVTGKGRGRNKRIISIKNNPDAYILLCHDCHVEYDKKILCD